MRATLKSCGRLPEDGPRSSGAPRSALLDCVMASAPPTGRTPIARPLLVHPERTALEHLAVQRGDGGARLVSLHLDEADATAGAGENVGHHPQRAHGSVLGEQVAE